MVMMDKVCTDCKKTVAFEVQFEDLEKYKNGAFVQDAFPYLTDDIRELFVSGICGKCFNNLFGPNPFED